MRGGQRRLVRPRRLTHSSGLAHGLLPCLPCFKEGPYQDRPPLCPFRLLPPLIYSGSAIAFFKFQGPKSKNIEKKIQSSFNPEQQPDPTNSAIIQSTLRASVRHIDGLTMAGMYKNCTKEESPEIGI